MEKNSILKTKVSGRKAIYTFTALIILALAFFLRIQVVSLSENPNPVRNDAADYFFYAYNFNKFGVYSRSSDGLYKNVIPKTDTYRSPGYSIFLMPFINDPPTFDNINSSLYAQTIFSFCAVLLCLLITIKLFPAYLALFSSLLVAISPHIINSNVYVLTESLFSSFLILSVWLYFISIKKNSYFLWLLLGISIGLTSLIRPTFQLFILVIIAYTFLSDKSPSCNKWLKSLIIIIGFSITFGSWVAAKKTYLNYNSEDSATLLTRGLYHGMFPNMMYKDRPETFGYAYRFDPNASNIDNSFNNIASEYYRRFSEQPKKHLKWYIIDKPIVFWQWDTIAGWKDTYTYPLKSTPYDYEPIFKSTYLISKTLYTPILLLALAGVIMIWIPKTSKTIDRRSLITLRIISLLIVYFTLLHIIFAPYPRYSFPLKPFLFIMSIYPISFTLGIFVKEEKTNASAPKP